MNEESKQITGANQASDEVESLESKANEQSHFKDLKMMINYLLLLDRSV